MLETSGYPRLESRFPRALPSVGGPTTDQDVVIDRNSSPPDGFTWKQASTRPLDMGGPTTRLFPRMGDDFSEKSAFSHLERVVEKYPAKTAIGLAVLLAGLPAYWFLTRRTSATLPTPGN